jgi:hypothetical protein
LIGYISQYFPLVDLRPFRCFGVYFRQMRHWHRLSGGLNIQKRSFQKWLACPAGIESMRTISKHFQ